MHLDRTILYCLINIVLLGSFYPPIIQGANINNTIRVLVVDGNKSHHVVKVKGVFHPRVGKDVYPNDEAIKGRIILYNDSDKDMVLYHVNYNKEQTSRNSSFFSSGYLIRAGECIIIHPFEEPDYWFQSPPSSIRVQSTNGQLSGAVRDIIDFVSSLENKGFIVKKYGTSCIIEVAH